MRQLDPWLTEAQVERLTRRKRPSAQMAVLAEAGIRFTVADGRPVVMVSALDLVAESKSRPQVRKLA